jgi:integrase
MEQAMSLRERADAERAERAADPGGDYFTDILTQAFADGVARERGSAEAKTLAGIARGTATPIMFYVETWLAKDRPRADSTKTNYKAAITTIADVLKGQGVTTLEAVTRRAAGDVIEALEAAGCRSRTSINNTMLPPVMAYWSWLQRRGILPEDASNPWHKQVLHVEDDDEPDVRAFTDDEVKIILAKATIADTVPRALGDGADVLRVLLLSGLRIREAMKLKVADCAGGMFAVIGKGKKPRKVPIHSDLQPTIAVRIAGKAPTDPVFPGQNGKARSPGAASNWYSSRWKSWGIDTDGPPRVTLHSTRHWFATQASNHATERVVKALIGHAGKDLLARVYDDGPSADMLRAAVEAIKLPA